MTLVELDVIECDTSKTDWFGGCGYCHQYLERKTIDVDALDVFGANCCKSDPHFGIVYMLKYVKDPYRYPVKLTDDSYLKLVKFCKETHKVTIL